MKKCTYCQEADESKLLMSTRLVNGRVETIDICFRCYWRERFEAQRKSKTRGDRRMNAMLQKETRLEEGVFTDSNPSVAGLD